MAEAADGDTGRVLIAGGGLAGLATARGLTAAGVPVKVFERVQAIERTGAVISVLANSARGLEAIGLSELVNESCIPVKRLEYRDWHSRYLAQMPIADVAQKLGTRTYIALRSDLQLGLYDAVGHGLVDLGCDVVGFEQDEEGVTVRFGDGREERGAALIGADGIRSAVRAQLIGDPPRYAGYSGWRGVTTMDPELLERGLGVQFFGRGRTFGAFGLGEGKVYWFSSFVTKEGRTDSAAGRKEDVRQTFARGPDLVQSIIEATPEADMLRNDIYDRKPVTRWGEGRVTLIGDAAHAATPNTGQGGSQALLDGTIVAERLAAAGSLTDAAAVRAALASYEGERIPQTSKVVKEAGLVGTFVHWSNPAACFVRDWIMYRLTPKFVWRKRATAYLAPNL
jgi:2-polyprenyl-6-methoxyphenol hydroxylase-like FAD-dependent oxidoreductase